MAASKSVACSESSDGVAFSLAGLGAQALAWLATMLEKASSMAPLAYGPEGAAGAACWRAALLPALVRCCCCCCCACCATSCCCAAACKGE